MWSLRANDGRPARRLDPSPHEVPVMTDTPRPGWWTCWLCKPPVHDRGGQAAFYAHWNRLHSTEGKR